jgi:hypothetical protein
MAVTGLLPLSVFLGSTFASGLVQYDQRLHQRQDVEGHDGRRGGDQEVRL